MTTESRFHDVTIVTIRGKTPQIDPTAWIAPGCRIIGDVTDRKSVV